MKVYTQAVLFLLLISNSSFAQINWSEDIAPILYEKCVNCHRPQGTGPYALLTYDDAFNNRYQIQYAITSGIMPPWLPNKDYRHFADEFYLTDDEIQLIDDWVNSGAASGNLADVPPLPPLPSGQSELDAIDFQIEIEPYTLQRNTDEYRWFVVDPGFTEDVYVNKMEVFPGLSNAVHHADLSYDITNASLNLDNQDPLPGFNSDTGGPNITYYMNAWQPGAGVASYPENWGIRVPAGAKFVLEMHYGPGAQGQIDSTRMNFQFVPASDVERQVDVGWLLSDAWPPNNGNGMTNGPLFIPANTEQTFYQKRTLYNDVTIISICPHMHYLGKSYKVWAEKPDGEIVPMIDIPRWDFNWQRYYTYPYLLKLPAGTVLHGEGVYDNTINNPYNPSNPPVNVSRGSRTQDEMFITYFTYSDYVLGDENIFMGDTIPDENVVGLFQPQPEVMDLDIFPNPSAEKIFLELPDEVQNGNIQITDIQGRIIHQYEGNNINEIAQDGIFISHLENGTYFLKISNMDKSWVGSFVKYER